MQLSTSHKADSPGERGAALLITFLVLIVVVMIAYQVNRITANEQIEARRSLVLTKMDFAIDAAFLQVEQDLLADAEEEGEEEGGEGDPQENPGAAIAGAGGEEGEGGGEGESGPVDSFNDEWATIQSTNIGDQDLSVYVIDEDRKFNILSMLAEDVEEAQEAQVIVARILDGCRNGTRVDIQSGTAEDMARAMKNFLEDRIGGTFPSPNHLADPDAGVIMPLSMREFVAIEPFSAHHFQDYLDEDGNRVHAIDCFLTVYSSPAIGPEGESQLGYTINVNTAPLPVLAGLFDPSLVDSSLWREIIDHRNEEQESEDGAQDEEPQLDEYGEPMVATKEFQATTDLESLPTMEGLDPETRDLVMARFKVDSQVFSITITARESTLMDQGMDPHELSREERERAERAGTDLVRTVRRVLWRQGGEEVGIHILALWDVLDHTPLELLDVEE
ncbi:MAG: general secretion pathway protein GspK [bacterium]|nr:general secretion pathway protein GspK [bacterium]